MGSIITKVIAGLVIVALILIGIIALMDEPKPSEKKQQVKKAAIRLNVFFESSMSMDGYVRGDNEFEAAMMTLVGGIGRSFQQRQMKQGATASSSTKIYSLEGINLYTVACGQDNNAAATSVIGNASISAIDTWFKNVEPTTLGSGSGRTATELKSVLQLALDSVGANRVSMVISDMILSPMAAQRAEQQTAVGGSSQMERILQKEQSQILNTFTDALARAKDRIAMIGYRFESRYDGFFTPEAKRPTPKSKRKAAGSGGTRVVMNSRPYYVWIIGTVDAIEQIARRVDLNGLRENRLTHSCLLIEPSSGSRVLTYSLVSPIGLAYPKTVLPKVGKYMLDGSNAVTVTSTAENRIVYAIDLKLPVSKQYAQVEVIAKATTAGHKDSVVSCERLKDGKYRVYVLSTFAMGDVPSYGAKTSLTFYHKKPVWFTEYSVDDDNGTHTDPVKERQTFGLRYLMEGVWRAFYPEEPAIGSLEVTLK